LEINKSLIIPLKEETKEVLVILRRFLQYLKTDTELIVVLDSDQDPTYEILKNSDLNIIILLSEFDPGASNAIKYGISKSSGKFICIAMGDGSDDPTQVEDLLLLVERGLSISVASRYSKGGEFVGKKDIKYFLSKYSGRLLYYFFRIGTKDPTNMFKAYDKNFLQEITIESSVGFTLGLELVVKAKLKRKSIGEIPTVWIDRTFGESKFVLRKFIPKYLVWVKKLIMKKI
jgi:dolichol-phosphate mannosyltransferase